MNIKLKRKIEDHFEYKWTKDRNMAFKIEGDLALLSQLPITTKLKIFSEFLYEDFLVSFKKTFTFENYDNNN